MRGRSLKAYPGVSGTYSVTYRSAGRGSRRCAARIADIGHDYVVVVEPNDLGVEFVWRYRLHGRP